jgi:hypothetical protein
MMHSLQIIVANLIWYDATASSCSCLSDQLICRYYMCLISGKASTFPNFLQDLLRGDAVLPLPVPHHDWREDIP